MNIQEFDKYLSENYVKPDLLVVHPNRVRWSSDLIRARIETPLGFYCYKRFEEKFVLMGEAMSESDANAWVDDNKEIEMWT